jgi:hypothetical protein
MIGNESPVAYVAQSNFSSVNAIDINKFHAIIGHCRTDRLKRTATIHKLKLKGELKVCEDCALAKARQKNVNQDWKGGSQAPGERVYLDISSIRDKSYGGSRFWVLIVDDYTDYCWIIFLKTKGDLKVKVMTLLTDLKIAGVDTTTQERIRHYMKNADLKVTVLSLSFQDLELLNVMVRLKESFKPSLGGLEQC